MRIYVQKGDVITIPAPKNLKSGDPVLLRSIFGFANADADEGEEVVVSVVGVYETPVDTGADVEAGQPIYFSEATGALTTNDVESVLVGYATAHASEEAGNATVHVRIG